MNFINLTPHAIHLLDQDDNVKVTYPASGQQVRLSTREIPNASADDRNARIKLVSFGEITDAPPEIPGTRYIVSLPTALAARRPDFVVPHEQKRDDNGQPIGCLSLARVM